MLLTESPAKNKTVGVKGQAIYVHVFRVNSDHVDC